MKKPRAKLTGQNGNVFNLAGIVCEALKKASRKRLICDECKHRYKCWTEKKSKCYLPDEFTSRLVQCESYDEALALMQEYVEAY